MIASRSPHITKIAPANTACPPRRSVGSSQAPTDRRRGQAEVPHQVGDADEGCHHRDQTEVLGCEQSCDDDDRPKTTKPTTHPSPSTTPPR